MKQIIDKLNKNSLLAGIVSTLLFIYFLEPILNFLGRTLIVFFRSISQTLYDRLFQEMALGKPDYSYILLQLLYITLINIFIAYFLKRLIRKKTIKSNKNEKTDESDEKILALEKEIGKSSKLNYFIPFSIVILFLMFVFTIVMADIKIKTIQTFEQQIRIITPYIDQHSKELLISDFSKMNTSSDFEKIKNSIEKIATKNNITLPKTSNHFF